MDPMSMQKLRAMGKYNRSRRLTHCYYYYIIIIMVAIAVLCIVLTSPIWLHGMCSLLSSFMATLPGLLTALLLSPKCLFVVGNLIVAFLVGESRLGGRPASMVDADGIRDEHTAASARMAPDRGAMVGLVGKEDEDEREEPELELELEKRVEDFIARVKRQRKLEARSFFDTDR